MKALTGNLRQSTWYWRMSVKEVVCQASRQESLDEESSPDDTSGGEGKPVTGLHSPIVQHLFWANCKISDANGLIDWSGLQKRFLHLSAREPQQLHLTLLKQHHCHQHKHQHEHSQMSHNLIFSSANTCQQYTCHPLPHFVPEDNLFKIKIKGQCWSAQFQGRRKSDQPCDASEVGDVFGLLGNQGDGVAEGSVHCFSLTRN